VGYWNQTCAISHLPIIQGQSVVIVAMVQNTFTTDLCYPESHYIPIKTPCYGEYDGYGGVENIWGSGAALVLNYARENLVEQNESMDFSILFQMDHDRKLFVNTEMGRGRLHFALIHQQVWDHIVEHHKFTVGEYTVGIAQLSSASGSIRQRDSRDPVVDYLKYLLHQWETNVLISIADAIAAADGDNVLKEWVKFVVVNSFMANVRKAWFPQIGVGTQYENAAPYNTLIDAMRAGIMVNTMEAP